MVINVLIYYPGGLFVVIEIIMMMMMMMMMISSYLNYYDCTLTIYIFLSLNVAIKLKSANEIDILFIGSPSSTFPVSCSILYIARQ